MRRTVWFFAVLLIASGAGAAFPQSLPTPAAPSEQNLSGRRESCTATNAARDQRCGISCQPGQTADCEDADASDLPTCECSQ